MAKIADLVEIKSGYANFVELKTSFEEDQQNLERMAGYRPTKAHRHAFERSCRGLMSPTDKKFNMLTGIWVPKTAPAPPSVPGTAPATARDPERVRGTAPVMVRAKDQAGAPEAVTIRRVFEDSTLAVY